MDKLTGKSLLEKLEEVSEESRRDQVIACGYFEIKSDGNYKVDFMGFTEAKMEAESLCDSSFDEEQDMNNPIATNKDSNLSILGTGVMICKYEISGEEFKKIKSNLNAGELDYDQLEIGWDEGDLVAPCFEPSIIINEDNINHSKSLESLGCKLNTSEENVTQKGSFFTICIENYKGKWGEIKLPTEHEFDISKLEVNRNFINIGSGKKMEKFEVAHISYMNDEYGELSNHSLEGKSKEWFLIDDQGEVISL